MAVIPDTGDFQCEGDDEAQGAGAAWEGVDSADAALHLAMLHLLRARAADTTAADGAIERIDLTIDQLERATTLRNVETFVG